MNTSAAPRPKPFLPSDLSADRALIHAAFATVMACAAANPTKGQSDDPTAICRQLFPEDKVALAIVTRADQTIGATTVSGWASQLVQAATASFLGSLGSQSAASELIRRGVSVTVNGPVTVPVRAAAPTAAPWTGEGSPVAMRELTIAPVELVPRKLGIITALSRSLARRSEALAVFEQMLRETAAMSLDAGFFSADAGTTVVHQGLLYGLSAMPGGGTIDDDLALLAAAVGDGGSGEVAFVMSSGLAASARIRAADLNVTILASPAIPAGRIIAVDPLSLIYGFGSEPDFFVRCGIPPGVSASSPAMLARMCLCISQR
jgi:hypothetical protein